MYITCHNVVFFSGVHTHCIYSPQVCCSYVMMHFRKFGAGTMSLFPCQLTRWMVVIGCFWSISLYDECMLVIMQVEERQGEVTLVCNHF